jgi:hypothetical protein
MLRKFLVLLSAIPLALSGIAPAVAANPLQITFESDDNSGYIHTDFDDAGPNHHLSTVVSGVDGNAGSVLKVVRGTASWAGTTIIKDQSQALIAVGTLYVTAKIYAPVAGKKLLMKVEKSTDVTQSVEAYATQNTVVGWNEYTFDFAIQRPGTEAFSANKTYNMASVFFDYTTTPNPSTAGQTYYLDDVTFASATAGSGGTGGGGDNGGGDNGGGDNGGGGVVNNAVATSTVLTYEANDALGALGAATASPAHPVGIFGGGTAAMVTDPVGLGSASNIVLAVSKTGEAWTGYNAIVDTDGTLRITDAQNPRVTFNYFSPKANSPVAVQLFIGETMDTQMSQTAAQGANSFTFDFSTTGTWSGSKIYTKLVIFPDFLVPTTVPPAIYYFDEIAINGGITSALPSVAPSNTVNPTITNKTFKVGTTLSSLKGSWLGTGNVVYKYTWYRCTVSSKTVSIAAPTKAQKCSTISGQKSSRYKLTKSDKGKYVRLLVTATNTLGSAYLLTKSTGKVS